MTSPWAGGHNGCDTRNDILRRDLVSVTIKPGSKGCTVATGNLSDPYTGTVIPFAREATSAAVEIDHVVALGNAWQTGAQQLSRAQRIDLANDPRNLQATDGPTNQAKGDGDAATWLPPNRSYRCTYVARQVEVKAAYHLWTTPAERQAITRVLTGCGATAPAPAARVITTGPTSPVAPTPMPTPTSTSTTSVTTTSAAPTTAAPAVPPPPETTVSPPAPIVIAEPSTPSTPSTDSSSSSSDSDSGSVYFKNCAAARAAGVAPLHRGEPGYRAALDRDNDGIACERR